MFKSRCMGKLLIPYINLELIMKTESSFNRAKSKMHLQIESLIKTKLREQILLLGIRIFLASIGKWSLINHTGHSSCDF